MSDDDGSTSLLVAECRKCGHAWVVAYLPMEASKLAKLAKRVGCPWCGDLKPLWCQNAEKVRALEKGANNTMTQKRTETITIRLPKDEAEFLDRVLATGIVGNTMDEVVAHMFKAGLLQRWVRGEIVVKDGKFEPGPNAPKVGP